MAARVLLWNLSTILFLSQPGTLFAAQSDHAPLVTSSDMSFRDIFSSALENTPEYLETPVREQQAEDYIATGTNWLAGRPSVHLNYYDDGVLDNTGLSEREFGLQLPLWRPGQRRDARELGTHYEEQVTTWKRALAWTVAGRVRRSLMAIAQAELGLALQNRAVQDAEQLRDVTMTLFEAGEVARLELMQTETLLVDKQAEMLQAQAAMVDAERAYNILTGLDVRPVDPHSEILTSQEDITEDHPQLRYMRSTVDLAGANVRQSENAAKGNPTLTIGSRWERPGQFQDTLNSVAIQLSIPFGGNAHVSSQASGARRDRVDAEVAYRNTYIQLNRALHEVEHDLFILGEEEPLRRSQMEISQERYEMALTAFEVGEVTLAEVVIAQQEAQESDRTLQMLLLERERLITEFNQLIGIMP